MRTLLTFLLLSTISLASSTRITQNLTVSERGTYVALNCQTNEKLGLASLSIQSSSPIAYFLQPLGFPEDSVQLWTSTVWSSTYWDYDGFSWTNYQDGGIAPLLLAPPTRSPDPYPSVSQARIGITCQTYPCLVSVDITYQCAVNPNWWKWVPIQNNGAYRVADNSTCTPACGQSTGVRRQYCSYSYGRFAPKDVCRIYGNLVVPDDTSYVCEDYQMCDSLDNSTSSSTGREGNSTDQRPNGVENIKSTLLVFLMGVLATMIVM